MTDIFKKSHLKSRLSTGVSKAVSNALNGIVSAGKKITKRGRKYSGQKRFKALHPGKRGGWRKKYRYHLLKKGKYG